MPWGKCVNIFLHRSNQQLYADAKAGFTGNMTHEFKTPVATVSAALESIKKYNLISNPETLQNNLDITPVRTAQVEIGWSVQGLTNELIQAL